jgi:catechol 2,3-dioxygenase-like lactoylglutathione lyase family enzyme
MDEVESMSSNIEVEKIGQIAIAITDLKASVGFYRNILGLELLFEVPPGLAFFNCGGTRLMLTTLQGKVEDHRTSVIYYKVSDIKGSTELLKNKGVVFEREPQFAAKMEDHDLWIGFLRDPDENLIGIMAEIPFE